MVYGTNPLIKMDYPDPDVIRVGDTYYMVSTTMHFMPGAVMLRSYDLIHWEICSYLYDKLESTPGECLRDGQNVYGHGMWAPSLRYHNGLFHVAFIAHEFDKTFLFTAERPEGPWRKRYIEGIYHDCSLLFDDDGRVYIVYGGRDIMLTELKEDLSGPKPGGLNRVIVRDAPGDFLGYEGSHLYKINGKYVLFVIHSLQKRWFRTQACFISDTLDGVWAGGDVLCSGLEGFGTGVAQGGVVDTPDGRWFAVLFMDHSAAGRMPVLVPVKWNRFGYPVFGEVTKEISNISTRPDYQYAPLYTSRFTEPQPDENGNPRLNRVWQFNHEPVDGCWGVTDDAYWIRSDRCSTTVEYACNTLTQRTCLPACSAEVTVDASGMKSGDTAGLCMLIGCYSLIGISHEEDGFALTMRARGAGCDTESEYACIDAPGNTIRLRAEAAFNGTEDTVRFLWFNDGRWEQLGVIHPMKYTMEHFAGCRFGLFMYSTREAGGCARFSDFVYNVGEE